MKHKGAQEDLSIKHKKYGTLYTKCVVFLLFYFIACNKQFLNI